MRVLVVDDNRDVADSTAALVDLWGHEVAVAYDADAAVLAAKRFAPQVILLDILIPKISGLALALRFRQLPEARDCIIIAISGFHNDEIVEASRQAGINHYLIKPVQPWVLEKLLTHGTRSMEV